jgi:hypothetical protein
MVKSISISHELDQQIRALISEVITKLKVVSIEELPHFQLWSTKMFCSVTVIEYIILLVSSIFASKVVHSVFVPSHSHFAFVWVFDAKKFIQLIILLSTSANEVSLNWWNHSRIK